MYRSIFIRPPWATGPRLAAALSLAFVVGCEERSEGAFEGPAGFSRQDSAESALAPATIIRDRGRLVTRALSATERRNPNASSAGQLSLGAELGNHYDEGLRLVAAANATAFVELRPLGAASHAPARLRHDGALVAYDEAYPGVSVAVGASDERVEARLRIPSAVEAPPLRFRLRTGPAFSRWESDEKGARWAYDREGSGFLRLAPPSTRDAEGRVVEGRWQVSEEGGEPVVEAELPWQTLAFPALVSVGFETPTWFPAGGPTPPSPRAAAGLTFYGGDQNCAVLFGGFDVGPTGTRTRDDVAVRCNGEWQVGPGGAGIPASATKPAARQDARLAYAPFTDAAKAGAYLFGGIGAGVFNDLWKLTLTGPSGGAKSATWARILPPSPQTADNWPSARFEAGLVWTGSGLLLFGGAAPNGMPLDDTWLFNGTSWTRVCRGPGCFPARRGFTPLTLGSGAATKTLVFGGYVLTATSVDTTEDIFTFTGSGWARETRDSTAPWPTLLDGTVASPGEVRPSPRFLAWGAIAANGQALVGSGGTLEGGTADPLDVWRLSGQSGQPRWARVPVTTSLPGRRVGAAAAFDPVAQATLLVGGSSFVPPDGTAPTLNPSPPLAYRGQTSAGSLRVTCHDPDDDGDCNTYTLQAQVALPGGASTERARAVFSRHTEGAWAVVGPACGLPGTPIGPEGDGVFRCEVTASFADASFAVQFQDVGYATGGALCSSTPNETIPFCNAPGLYEGVVACRGLPFGDGESIDCGD
ncbi:MAG TPA: kelch repeat-containing protein [Polyangiaceae bacterium]|nr:kelch repeat-containing protein [Polyangiaceae bacterium]